jgi:hypothetical protein
MTIKPAQGNLPQNLSQFFQPIFATEPNYYHIGQFLPTGYRFRALHMKSTEVVYALSRVQGDKNVGSTEFAIDFVIAFEHLLFARSFG